MHGTKVDGMHLDARFWKGLMLAGALVSTLVSAPVQAAVQSEGLSRASAGSVRASAVVPVAFVEAVAAGGAFVVTGISTAADASVAVTVSAVGAVGAGTSLVLELSGEAVKGVGLAVGSAVVVTVLATGWMLSVAGEALCFIVSPELRPHIHSREISG